MPIYVYETVTETGDGDRFEILQSLHDAPLGHHPDTGEPVRRIVAAPGRILSRGLRRSARVDKSSAAATPCGCASSAALAVATRASGVPGTGAAKSHAHHGHHHHHHGACSGHHHEHAKPSKPAGDTGS